MTFVADEWAMDDDSVNIFDNNNTQCSGMDSESVHHLKRRRIDDSYTEPPTEAAPLYSKYNYKSFAE